MTVHGLRYLGHFIPPPFLESVNLTLIIIVRCDGVPACKDNRSPSCILDSSGPTYGLSFLSLMKVKVSIATFIATDELFEIQLNFSLVNFRSNPYSELENLFIKAETRVV